MDGRITELELGQPRLHVRMILDDAIDLSGGTAQSTVAFDDLMRPLIDSAHRLAYGMLRDHHAAEDAVQEATFRAWHRFHQLRPGSSVRPWYFAIVANECRNQLRGRWRWVLRQTELQEWDEIRGESGPEEASVLALDLKQALARLSFDHRLVLCLHHFLDLPEEEIARTLGVRPGTVKSRLHRATAKLRRHLDSGGGEAA